MIQFEGFDTEVRITINIKGMKSLKMIMDRKKLIKCIALSIFLMTITIMPSFEAIDFRYRKSVDLSENPVTYQIKAGDVIEQKLILDKGDRFDDLRIWLSSDTRKENKGILQVALMQGETVAESKIDTSRIVGAICFNTPETVRIYGW